MLTADKGGIHQRASLRIQLCYKWAGVCQRCGLIRPCSDRKIRRIEGCTDHIRVAARVHGNAIGVVDRRTISARALVQTAKVSRIDQLGSARVELSNEDPASRILYRLERSRRYGKVLVFAIREILSRHICVTGGIHRYRRNVTQVIGGSEIGRVDQRRIDDQLAGVVVFT